MTAPSEKPRPRRRAVFVDRDGTLMPDLHYLADPAATELSMGVGDGLRLLRQHEYLVVCVTNQSGVERGLFSEATVHQIHRQLNERLRRYGASIDAFYHCPHTPEQGCECRKPGTALFLQAAEDWAVDFPTSAIIGDRSADVEAGTKLGLFTVLVPEVAHDDLVNQELAERHVRPDARVSTFGAAAAAVLRRG
ncbi:MAG: HAD family hydrolase [Thermoplasmata archaeon]|nr:HAD family hydrolase [Thermoplasmata archaeon]